MARQHRRQQQSRSFSPSVTAESGSGGGWVLGIDAHGEATAVPLASAAAFEGIASGTSTNFVSAIPEKWEDRAKKAWTYYTEEPLVKHCLNAWRSFAVGDDVRFASNDAAVQEAINAFAKEFRIGRFVRDMILQLLVKGDALGFRQLDTGGELLDLVCVNPVSVEVKYVDGKLAEAKQKMEDPSTGRATSDPAKDLPVEQCLHVKWDAPPFSARGNSMVLPAFESIELLRDYRRAEKAIAKRWATPLRFITVGGAYGSKLVMPDQAMLNQISQMINRMDPKTGLVVPFYVDVKTYGTDGEVLKAEEKVQEVKEDIVVAMGMSRTLVTGDGPNFATASISFQKMLIMIRDIKQMARDIVQWVIDPWLEEQGHTDAGLQIIFNDLDPTDSIEFKKLLMDLYDRKVISRKTLQMRMDLDPDVEDQDGANPLLQLDEKQVKPIADLVVAGIVDAAYAAKILGVPQEALAKAVSAPPALAGHSEAHVGTQGAAEQKLCDECQYFDAEHNRCRVTEHETTFDTPACRFIGQKLVDLQVGIDE